MITFRQGDVLLICVDSIPSAAERQAADARIVLAYGEVTGHAHAIAADEATEYRAQQPLPVFDWQCERFIEVQVKALLRHEEHETIEIPAGRYAVIRQREYAPDALRNVAD